MGKAAKEHRAKVAKRNEKIKQQKSAMQRAFDALLKAQTDEMLEKENLNVKAGEKNLDFEILGDIQPEVQVEQQSGFRINLDAEESAKINKEFEETQPTEE
jgi:sRNA-binding protein